MLQRKEMKYGEAMLYVHLSNGPLARINDSLVAALKIIWLGMIYNSSRQLAPYGNCSL